MMKAYLLYCIPIVLAAKSDPAAGHIYPPGSVLATLKYDPDIPNLIMPFNQISTGSER